MSSCVFRYCKNTKRNSKSSAISFHRFVRHAKREQWIRIIQNNRSENTWLPTEHSFVCSAHFNADDFYLTKAGKRFLKNSADSPRKNKLKKDLRKSAAAQKKLKRKMKRLYALNRRLKRKMKH